MLTCIVSPILYVHLVLSLNSITWHFFTLNYISHFILQSQVLFRSSCRISQYLLLCLNNFASSVDRLIQLLTFSSISFIYTRKSTDLWTHLIPLSNFPSSCSFSLSILLYFQTPIVVLYVELCQKPSSCPNSTCNLPIHPSPVLSVRMFVTHEYPFLKPVFLYHFLAYFKNYTAQWCWSVVQSFFLFPTFIYRDHLTPLPLLWYVASWYWVFYIIYQSNQLISAFFQYKTLHLVLLLSSLPGPLLFHLSLVNMTSSIWHLSCHLVVPWIVIIF